MNINRDYLIINDVKKSNVKLDNGSIFFYITDKNTQNIFVNLVINVSNNDLIQKYANIENAEDYTLTMNIVKPDNTYKIIEGKLHDKEKAIFEFDLKEDCVDKIGTYKCELLTKCNINDHEEITTSNKLTYKVKSSVLNDLDDIVEAPEYPLVIQLFDKLSDINQYEEDRRANELARQLAEQQRQTRFNALDADMANRVTAMDDKMVDVENRVSTKEQAVDKLIVDTKKDIDDYKVAKDTEIDEYKTAKDTEINQAITNQDNKILEAITNQDNKIDTAINAQNDRITVVENNDVAQDNRLDVLENKDVLHESRLDVIEVKNQQQDSRLDIVENKNTQQDNRLNDIEAKNVEQDNRLNEIEAIDVAQNSRLDAIEVKNQQQDDRLLAVEKVNKRQDMDLKCLFAESKNNMIDVTEEGNSIYLQNSTVGYTLIDEIQGNTLVNCNKEPDKQIVLNGNINTSGDNTVTITEGVDGGKVDVALEGNTLVNVSKTKDSTALPLEEELTYLYANTQYVVQFIADKAITADITLGGTQLLAQNIVKGLNRISITTPETLANNKLIIDGVGAKISEVVVTDTDRGFGYFEGMKSVGECEDLEVVSSNSDGTLSTTQTLTHEPLRAVGDIKDKYVLIDGKWYIERNCIELILDGSADENYSYHSAENNIFYRIDTVRCKGSLVVPNISDKIYDTRNYSIMTTTEMTMYHNSSALIIHLTNDLNNIDKFRTYLSKNPLRVILALETPIYEPLDYNPFAVYSDITHISNNSTIPCNMAIKNTGYNCLLKPSTTYTVSSNLGLNVVTTPNVLTEDCLRFMDTDTSSVTTMNNVVVLEGDYTTGKPIPSHFSGIESTFEQEYDEGVGKYKVKVRVQNEDMSKENYIEFYIGEPLRGIGDVKDKVYVKNDKVVVERNCGSVTFDGSEDGWYIWEDNTNCISFAIIINWNTPNHSFSAPYNYIYTDKFLRNTYTKNLEWFTSHSYPAVKWFAINLLKAKLQTQDVAGFKQWLQQNPTTVVYQLAEPTYEEVEYDDVKLFIESFKNSTLFYNSNVPVTSKLYYSYSVPIVDTVAQTASISDEQDQLIIDLATQVAVLEMMTM